mgnify:CR=1 FL=1
MNVAPAEATTSRSGYLWRRTRALFLRTVASPVSPVWRHALYVFLWAYVPGMVVTILAAMALAASGVEAPAVPRLSWRRAGWAILVAPLIETVTLAAIVWISSVWIRSWSTRAVLVALVAGLLHALESPFRFFGPAWGFFVMACGYQAWTNTSMWRAYAVAILPHTLANALTFSLLWGIDAFAPRT